MVNSIKAVALSIKHNILNQTCTPDQPKSIFEHLISGKILFFF